MSVTVTCNSSIAIPARCRTHNVALRGLKGDAIIEMDFARYRKSVRTRACNQMAAGVRTINGCRSMTGGVLSFLERAYNFELPIDLTNYWSLEIPVELVREAEQLCSLMNSECALVAAPHEAVGSYGEWFFVSGGRLGYRQHPAKYRESILLSRLAPLVRKCVDQHTLDTLDKCVQVIERAERVTFTANLEFTL